jgi:hypothetical protein
LFFVSENISMKSVKEQWSFMLILLESIREELQSMNGSFKSYHPVSNAVEHVHVSFKGSEIYLLCKAFIDSGGAPHDNYKTLLVKLVPHIANKTQKGFSPQSFCKFSDKVDPESKENVKRFLQKMIRNIDSYD